MCCCHIGWCSNSSHMAVISLLSETFVCELQNRVVWIRHECVMLWFRHFVFQTRTNVSSQMVVSSPLNHQSWFIDIFVFISSCTPHGGQRSGSATNTRLVGDPLSRFRTVVQHRWELSSGVEPKLSTLRTFCLISDRTGCCALPPGWMETENQQHLSLSLDMLEKTPPISFTSVFKCVIEVHGLLSWHENMISTVQLQN